MIIPNSFQTPNLYIDRAMPYLTDSELRCLIYATRHILGWQDRIGRQRGNISISMFEHGFTTKDGIEYAGCGLGRGTIISALKSLTEYGLLIRIGTAGEHGQEWELGSTGIQWEKLEHRQSKTIDAFRDRTAKARKAKAEKQAGGLLNNTGTVEQTTGGLLNNTPPGLLNNTESKPSSKQHTKPSSAPQNGAGTSPAKTAKPRKVDAIYDAISEVWDTTASGLIVSIKSIMVGTSKRATFKDSNFDPPVTDAQEIRDFGPYMRKRMASLPNKMTTPPTSPQVIQAWFYDWRKARDTRAAAPNGYIPVEQRTSPLDGINWFEGEVPEWAKS